MNFKIRPIFSLTLLAAALAGCTATPAVVRTGDQVDLGFTCRLPNRELAATTKPDSAVMGDKKSPYYLPRTGPDTITLTAGMQPDDPKQDRLTFEEEIMKSLSKTLNGLREGEPAVRELKVERFQAESPSDSFVRMALVRKRQKQMRMTREEYSSRTGKSPEVGQRYIIDPLVPGMVSEITDKEVVVHFALEPGKPLTSPFGPITVRETPTQFELEINAEKGRLVRTGGVVGRISAVEGDFFEIDFSHPFGGETLSCDVTVASVKPAATSNVQPEPVHETNSGDKLDPEAKKVFNTGLANMLSMSVQPVVNGDAARAGDLVSANFTVTLEDGTLVATTQEKTFRDPALKKVSWYREPVGFGPMELVAGKREFLPGLGEALVGMKTGEKQRITLTADKAFGMPDPQKQQQLPCSQTFPRIIRMPAKEYVKRFSAFPVLNKEVDLLPYFKSRVTEVTESDVALEFLVADGASFNDDFGVIGVAVVGDKITTTLKARVGAPFQVKDAVGLITSTDGTTFTVDLNHPLAGKTIVMDVETVAITQVAQGAAIDWIDDHDAGLARAKQESKPVFLILHADWCGWCKKTFSETIPDPRIMALKDRFVWVRVNSDKDQKYKQLYGQEGFPMMVLLNADGSVLKKIDGYRDAKALSEEIKAVLN